MNTQRPEKRTLSDMLDLHSMFMTIQGEGPFAGRPAIFIRLAGCNLQCPLCDTEYTSGRQLQDPCQVAGLAIDMAERWEDPLFVITGGEPFRQPVALVALVQHLVVHGDVQVETNGSLWHQMLVRFDCDPNFHIVVSPKSGAVHKDIAFRARAWKYVAKAADIAEDGLPRSALDHPVPHQLPRPVPNRHGVLPPVYLQPADEYSAAANADNQRAVIASCLANGYIYCHQLHKTIGVP